MQQKKLRPLWIEDELISLSSIKDAEISHAVTTIAVVASSIEIAWWANKNEWVRYCTRSFGSVSDIYLLQNTSLIMLVELSIVSDGVSCMHLNVKTVFSLSITKKFKKSSWAFNMIEKSAWAFHMIEKSSWAFIMIEKSAWA